MRGAAARISRIGAITCRSHWRCHSSSGSSSRGRAWLVPASLTRTSMPPNASSQAAIARSPASGTTRSRASVSARPPTSSAARARASPWRATRRTPAPSPASPRATARPIPRLAPVTTHALPSSPRSIAPGMMRQTPTRRRAPVKSHTVYRTFDTDERREWVRITDEVQEAVDQADVSEGMVLVSAMHITAGVWVNDDEPGILADALEWLDKLAPPSWQPPANDVARELLPDPGDYRHHRGGEDNGDAHLKNLLVHHQVVLPITDGELDLGPWQQVFYAEFDGRRRKRLVIKVLGE